MITFQLRDISTSLRRAMAVVPNDGIRPGLELVQWHVWPERIVLVGTDGTMLVEVQHNGIVPQELFEPFVAGLPISSMRALIAYAARYSIINVAVNDTQWVFDNVITTTAYAEKLPSPAQAYKRAGGTPMQMTIARDLLRKAAQIAPGACTIMTTKDALILSGHNFRAVVMGMLPKSRVTHPFTSLLGD